MTYAKYNARRTTVDGITFDSHREAARYQELKLLELAGEIEDLELQPTFDLLPSYIDDSGKKQRAVIYRADFRYWDKQAKHVVVEDVKGVETPVFKLKHRMLMYMIWQGIYVCEFRIVK